MPYSLEQYRLRVQWSLLILRVKLRVSIAYQKSHIQDERGECDSSVISLQAGQMGA